MSEPRRLRCYEYVDRSYDRVRVALHERALETLQQATTSAMTRANALAATLRIDAAGIAVAVGVDVRIHVKKIRDEEGIAGLWPLTILDLTWTAEKTPSIFPAMSAELTATPMASDETQLVLEGEYRPPLGAVGRAVDVAVGHRIAEASVHHFLRDIAQQLRRDLPQRG